MSERPGFHLTARRALNGYSSQREAATRCLKQLDALDAAWKENETARGGVLNLIDLQERFCRMAGAPLLFSEEVPW